MGEYMKHGREWAQEETVEEVLEFWRRNRARSRQPHPIPGSPSCQTVEQLEQWQMWVDNDREELKQRLLELEANLALYRWRHRLEHLGVPLPPTTENPTQANHSDAEPCQHPPLANLMNFRAMQITCGDCGKVLSRTPATEQEPPTEPTALPIPPSLQSDPPTTGMFYVELPSECAGRCPQCGVSLRLGVTVALAAPASATTSG
jgi:hypothetical protein